MRTMRLTAAVAAVLAGACAELPTGRGDASVSRGDPVPLTRLLGEYPAWDSKFYRQEQRVVENAAEWEDVWRQLWHGLQPMPAVPPVDFDREVVLLAAMGSRGTGGYVVRVEDATAFRDHVLVRVLETSPGTCRVGLAVSAPADVVTMPRASVPVRFRVEQTVHDCG